MPKADQMYVDFRTRSAKRYVRELIREGLSDEDVVFGLLSFCGAAALRECLDMPVDNDIVDGDVYVTVSFTYSKSDAKDGIKSYRPVK